jgi:hypothetical protein
VRDHTTARAMQRKVTRWVLHEERKKPLPLPPASLKASVFLISLFCLMFVILLWCPNVSFYMCGSTRFRSQYSIISVRFYSICICNKGGIDAAMQNAALFSSVGTDVSANARPVLAHAASCTKIIPDRLATFIPFYALLRRSIVKNSALGVSIVGKICIVGGRKPGQSYR